MADEAGAPVASRRIVGLRLGTGLTQGVVLYLLGLSADHKVWPSTAHALFGALILIAAIVPLIPIGGYGRIRRVPLALWTLAAAVVLAMFAWHDIDAGIWGRDDDPVRAIPAFQVFLFSAIFVFVGHHLVGPADEARRFFAPYRTYFDWAWKDAVQIALSAAFVGVLWAALFLGAALFRLIGIEAVGKIIEQGWFGLPLTCLAFAAGVQLTDVQVALIRGVRLLGLVLLSWLLPVMTLIAIAFLASLPFTGLGKLFGAQSAAATMLSACAVLVVLISATYQDGEAKVPVFLRWTALVAAMALGPPVLIAAIALWLRVQEHGLTPARIEAIACAVVAAGFAIGYADAALRSRRGPWMKPVEFTNVIMARLAMLVIFLMFTPIADPARIAVGDQVSRLTAGATAPDKFDFAFLRFQAGKYGADALKQLQALKGTPRNLAIAAQATDAAKADHPSDIGAAQSFLSRLRVYPAGATLPKSFTDHDWRVMEPGDWATAPTCYWNGQCEAYLLDVDGDGVQEVLLAPTYTDQAVLNLDIYKLSPQGSWQADGYVNVSCPEGVAAMRAGQFSVAPSAGRDLVVGGRHELIQAPEPACPETGGAVVIDIPPAKAPPPPDPADER